MNLNVAGNAGIQEALRTAVGTISDDEAAAADAETAAEEEATEEAAEETEETEEKAEGETEAEEKEEEKEEEKADDTKKPGIDKVLQHLTSTMGPNAAEVVRGLQRELTRRGESEGEVRRLQAELREYLPIIRQIAAQQNEEPDDAEQTPIEIEGVPPEQIKLFEQVAERLGFVKRDQVATDLETRESRRLQESITTEATKRALEAYGDSLGTMEGETLVINPEAKAKMQPIYARLVEQQALTWEDLYRLANHDDLIARAKAEGAEEARKAAQNGQQQRVARTRRAATVDGSAGSAGPPKVYDPKIHKGVKGLRSVITNVINNLDGLEELASRPTRRR